MDIKSIIRKVLNELDNDYMRNAYDLDDIDIDDDTETNATINSMQPFTPNNKFQLKKWCFMKLLREGVNANLNFVDTSQITDMSWLFGIDLYNPRFTIYNGRYNQDKYNREALFKVVSHRTMKSEVKKAPLNVETSLYTDLHSFLGSINPDISEWDVSNVKNMKGMFSGCYKFNRNLNDWDVHNVINMKDMFCNCFAFNSPLDNWHVENVRYATYMFSNAQNFSQDLSNWNLCSLRRNIDSRDKLRNNDEGEIFRSVKYYMFDGALHMKNKLMPKFPRNF